LWGNTSENVNQRVSLFVLESKTSLEGGVGGAFLAKEEKEQEDNRERLGSCANIRSLVAAHAKLGVNPTALMKRGDRGELVAPAYGGGGSSLECRVALREGERIGGAHSHKEVFSGGLENVIF